MSENENTVESSEDTGMSLLVGIGLLVGTVWLLSKLFNSERPTPEQRHLSRMQQEMARLLSEGYDV